jgi:aspartate/methionine/tyrosine aminotransferase
MVPMTCEEHDKIASGTQFVTHLTGRVLSGLNLEPTAIDTKGYQMLHTVTKNTTRDSFDLFFGLYKHNDFSSQQLLLMEKALNKVKSDLSDYEEKLDTEKKSCSPKTIVFNPRVESLERSKTTLVTDIASEMKQKGIDVITLSVGEPDFQPPEVVVNALNEAIKSGLTKYTPLVGTPALRKAIAEYLLREKKIKYSPDEIICSCGAKQSIYQAVMVLCRPGDEVLIPAPYWVSYSEIVKLSGAKTKIIPTTARTNYCLTPDQLSNEINEKTRLLILCNPSNPTGHVYDVALLEKLAAVLRKHPQVYILTDEIYEKILYDATHVAFASLEGMWERTITVNGFSKSHAMTGLRLGYLAAPKSIVSACTKVQSHITSCPASIVQHAGVVALEKTPQEYFTKSIAGFREKRDLVISEFSKIGLNVPVPQGAFYVFFDVSNYLTSSVPTSNDLCVYLLEKFHIALVPGEAFGMDNHIRLSYALALDRLREALKRLANGLTSLKNSAL